jgi:hypothetical protein
LENEFGGLLLEVGDAAGWSGRGLFEGFRFVVSHAAGDDRVEDAGELVRGFAQAGFHPATILAELVLAVAQGLSGEAQGGGHAANDFGRFSFEHLAAADPVVRTQAEPKSDTAPVP